MPLLTTCIGAYPKPDFVNLPDWFNLPAGPDVSDPTKRWAGAMEQLGDEAENILARGVAQAVADQVEAGIDIMSTRASCPPQKPFHNPESRHEPRSRSLIR